MSYEIINQAHQILQTTDEFYLPIKKLYKIIYEKGGVPLLTIEEFEKLLQDDERFVFHEKKDNEDEEDDEEARKELEELGYFRGPLVGLVDRKPSKKDLEAILAKKMETMINSLQKAYEVRPKDDPGVEDQLLQAMLKAKNLKDKIGEVFEKEATEDKDNEEGTVS